LREREALKRPANQTAQIKGQKGTPIYHARTKATGSPWARTIDVSVISALPFTL
jgi:hypothetical protein